MNWPTLLAILFYVWYTTWSMNLFPCRHWLPFLPHSTLEFWCTFSLIASSPSTACTMYSPLTLILNSPTVWFMKSPVIKLSQRKFVTYIFFIQYTLIISFLFPQLLPGSSYLLPIQPHAPLPLSQKENKNETNWKPEQIKATQIKQEETKCL